MSPSRRRANVGSFIRLLEGKVHHALQEISIHNFRSYLAYAGEFIEWARSFFGYLIEIVKRPKEQKGFVVLPRRWVVERTFLDGWDATAV